VTSFIFAWHFGPRRPRRGPYLRQSVRSRLGLSRKPACEVILGAGAGAALEVCATSGRRTSGRPERWLVTIGGEPGSSVAFATNSNAISAKPATAKKARAGIAAF
jgi:hypothetical protein